MLNKKENTMVESPTQMPIDGVKDLRNMDPTAHGYCAWAMGNALNRNVRSASMRAVHEERKGAGKSNDDANELKADLDAIFDEEAQMAEMGLAFTEKVTAYDDLERWLSVRRALAMPGKGAWAINPLKNDFEWLVDREKSKQAPDDKTLTKLAAATPYSKEKVSQLLSEQREEAVGNTEETVKHAFQLISLAKTDRTELPSNFAQEMQKVIDQGGVNALKAARGDVNTALANTSFLKVYDVKNQETISTSEVERRDGGIVYNS
ncbi:MAG TPA: hypothetical protein EYQ14_25840 [Gammaproteobacteria bacterium]|nr:hypothetical protein [Gammaproteobacteria bacterium]